MKDKRIIPAERIILLCFIGPEYRGCNPLADCKGRAIEILNNLKTDKAKQSALEVLRQIQILEG